MYENNYLIILQEILKRLQLSQMWILLYNFSAIICISHFYFPPMNDKLLSSFRVSLLSLVRLQLKRHEASCLPVCLPVRSSLLLPPPSVITSFSAHRLTVRWGQHREHNTRSLFSVALWIPSAWKLQANGKLFFFFFAHKRCHSLQANQPVGIGNSKFCFISLEG